MKDKKIGLILGKIAPFHKGHNFLIDTALKIVDELIFVVYDCPDRIHIPTNVRAEWIRKQYPQIDVVEGWDAPNEHNDSDIDVQRKQELYISKVLNGRKVTHFISSEKYGEHMSKHLKAENVVVDMNRRNINISSTMIRENVLKYKRYLPDIVYSDLITKVAFVGFDWASKNKLINKLAKKNNIISGPLCLEPSNEKTIRQLIRRNSRKLYENKRLKGANLFAFWGNTLIECFVLLNGTQRIYQSDIKEEAIKQIRDFDIVFTNFNSDKNVNCVNSDFLNNQLISLLTTNAINYISLEGTLTQKENSAKKAIDLNLKNKRFI